MEPLGRKFLAWALALGLGLSLIALLVATGESIRHAEIASSRQQAAGPEAPVEPAPLGDTYHDPGRAAWMTP